MLKVATKNVRPLNSSSHCKELQNILVQYSLVKKAVMNQVFDPKSFKGILYYIVMSEFSLKHYWGKLIMLLCYVSVFAVTMNNA